LDASPGFGTVAPHGFIPAVCSTRHRCQRPSSSVGANDARRAHTGPCRRFRFRAKAAARRKGACLAPTRVELKFGVAATTNAQVVRAGFDRPRATAVPPPGPNSAGLHRRQPDRFRPSKPNLALRLAVWRSLLPVVTPEAPRLPGGAFSVVEPNLNPAIQHRIGSRKRTKGAGPRPALEAQSPLLPRSCLTNRYATRCRSRSRDSRVRCTAL
jgi:hypothetical protein